MICPICTSSNVALFEIAYPFIRHLDFATIEPSGLIGRCGYCQSLFQSVDAGDIGNIVQQFQGEPYAQSKQTNQTFKVNEFDEPVSRSFLQAELICSVIHKERLSILDIGCFDGELLVQLGRRFTDASLHGFEVNERLRLLFPQEGNFRFWSSDLDSVRGDFDMICLSHSMMYVKDTVHLMESIKRLMKRDGVLFIQMPDISVNPCYILMADQYYYYTSNILKNIMLHFGFTLSLLSNNWFPKEIVAIARLTPEAKTVYTEDLQIYQCIKDLRRKVSKLKAISNDSRVGVLGTTGNAAFVDNILGDKMYCFFDESPNRLETTFRGKDVRHPAELQPSDLLVIPYGQAGAGIQERFASQYHGQFLLV